MRSKGRGARQGADSSRLKAQSGIVCGNAGILECWEVGAVRSKGQGGRLEAESSKLKAGSGILRCLEREDMSDE
jgi:hypothetical protein